MTLSELFGGLLLVSGLFLAAMAHRGGTVALLSVPRGMIPVLILTGLLVLLALGTQPASWWDNSAAEGMTRTLIYWLGAGLTLAGGTGVALGTGAGLPLRVSVMLLAGGLMCLLGLAGDAFAGSVALLGLCVAAWPLLVSTSSATDASAKTADAEQLEGNPTDGDEAAHEPLLVCVSVVVLMVLLEQTLHDAATEPARRTSPRGRPTHEWRTS